MLLLYPYKCILCALSLFLLLIPQQARAQEDMAIIHNLSFGTFAVRDNTAVHTITVTHDTNQTIYGPDIIGGNTPGQRGEYLFTGLPANVTFFVGVSVPNPPTEGGVTLDNASNITVGGGPFFTVDNFTANDLVTDALGTGTLNVGATLRTTGTLGTYAGGVYNGDFEITLHY